MKKSFFPALQKTIEALPIASIPAERMPVIESMVAYILDKIKNGEELRLNFICTHNSRRSQFSQIWAQTAADYYGIEAFCYSGGVEVTAFNERAVSAIRRDGFKVVQKGEGNPVYFVFHGEESDPIITFSKVYDDAINAQKGFAAVMTCDHADENCPFIPGAEVRIPLRFEDPKAFDGTDLEEKMYSERSHQIGAELFLIFQKVKEAL
ncbi:protein-tyrosine-phosphatase [Algoriphagus sp. AK58]|uniref:protein-tyrosine-phosphatase n=1 Tax=Algoriphagus sp. AK58 TaxID=1406877 RepID=UPI0016502BBF|nr:protein-tyrosine-phosphatase [Algoriphagus sp. AK58]MBC6365346.1 protein-tyrosine-phosphatase [Algoriphagus sp. AK58]